MISARLPEVLRPKPSSQMIRLGRDNDGGYLVDQRDVAAADGLITFGLSDDWSFEQDFVTGRRIPLHSYDATLTRNFLLSRPARGAGSPRTARERLANLRKLGQYHLFFFGRRKHVRKFVGLQSDGAYIAIDEVFRCAAKAGMTRPFLKIDIEGGEYVLLDALLATAGQSAGLVIEFHDCHRHIDVLSAFVTAHPLRLAHIHGNNHSPVTESGIPQTMELTFSSSPADGTELCLPHALDMPCHRTRSEIQMDFTSG